jgi:hypothetical protein
MVEAAILPFDDGRLYLVYSAGQRADFVEGGMPEGEIRLMGRWSHDEGDTWSEPFLVRECDGIPNVMEPSCVRLPIGRVLMSYMQRDTYVTGGDAFAGMYPKIAHSDDDCSTWSEPTGITGEDARFFTTNDRLLRLSTGRIILPVLIAPDMNRMCVWLSDDDGTSWRRGRGDARAADNARCGYPVAVELADGAVAMFMKPTTKCIQIACSTDGGDSWTLVNPSGPEPCPATYIVGRIPNSADLLLIWNNHTQRTNLTSAISRDHGATWSNYRLLEAQRGWPVRHRYAFPSLAFLHDCAHMTWYERTSHPDSEARFDLIYRRLPISCFQQ